VSESAVIEALEAMDPPLVDAIGAALTFADADGPWSYLGWTLAGWEGKADSLVHLRLACWLDFVRMGRWDLENVLNRLEDANGSPWPELRDALIGAGRP
jgi:hypothetical protein